MNPEKPYCCRGQVQRLVRRGITPLVIIRPGMYRELRFDYRGQKMDKGNQIFGVILFAAFLYACYSFSRLSGTYSGDKHPGNQRPVNQPPLVTTR